MAFQLLRLSFLVNCDGMWVERNALGHIAVQYHRCLEDWKVI